MTNDAFKEIEIRVILHDNQIGDVLPKLRKWCENYSRLSQYNQNTYYLSIPLYNRPMWEIWAVDHKVSWKRVN